MKIHYFFREFHQHQISIEKLFDTIINEVNKNNEVSRYTNPNPFTILGCIQTLFYFRKRQGEINHITGDIHWSCLLLDSNKTVLTIHDLVGLQQLSGLKKQIYFLFWVYLPVKKLKYITAISEKTRNEIINLMPSAKEKISVIPNCVTVSVDPFKKNEIIDKPEILIVGTRNNKNIDSIFDALRGLNVKLTIIGELSWEEKSKLKDYGLNYENFINISDVEVEQLYRNANILCFPSFYEGFGLPILEAQAKNCAVITSKISPLKEVAGNAAVLVDPNSVSEIKNALIKLINDHNFRNQMVLAGKENVKKYLPQTVANLYINLYKEILKK